MLTKRGKMDEETIALRAVQVGLVGGCLGLLSCRGVLWRINGRVLEVLEVVIQTLLGREAAVADQAFETGDMRFLSLVGTQLSIVVEGG